MQIPVTAAATAVCSLLLVFLAFRVSRMRLRHRVALGDGGNAELMRAIRTHANTVEYVPVFLLMSLCYELYAGSNAMLLTLVATFVVARLIFAWGMSQGAINVARRIGALLTYLSSLLLALLLLGTVVSRV